MIFLLKEPIMSITVKNIIMKWADTALFNCGLLET